MTTFNRVFIDSKDTLPVNSVVGFSTANQVGDYFGSVSYEEDMAKEYFSGANANNAKMLFTRYSAGQRPHLIGASLSSLSYLQQLKGSISIGFFGFTYSGNVNLRTSTSYAQVAIAVREALHHNSIAATTSGDTITPEEIDCTGQVAGVSIHESSGPPLVIGGVISGAGVRPNDPAGNAQIINRTADGNWHTFADVTAGSITPDEPLKETYGILHIGSRLSGQIKAGLQVIGNGIAKSTAIIANLGGGNWLVNNAQSISGNFTIVAPSLTVQDDHIVGPDGSRDFLMIQPGGQFGFDNAPSALTFASGSVADALELTQTVGALDSTPGGQHPTFTQYMNNIVTITGGAFDSFQTVEPRLDLGARNWEADHSQYAFNPRHLSTTPAGTL